MSENITEAGRIDTRLSELYGESASIERSIDSIVGRIHDFAGDYRRHGKPRALSFDEAVETARAHDTYRDAADRALASLSEARDQCEAVASEIGELEAKFDAEPWSRFYLVPGGHIHSSMYCSTCNRDGKLTKFGWLPEMSGQTEEVVVAEHGALLCTVCFPSAPVHWTNALEEAAKARKAAQCPGSGSYLNTDLPHRTGFYRGNWATCPECGETPALTSTGKLRAHKPKKN